MLCNYPSLCNVVNRTCVSWHRIGFMIEDVIELVFLQKRCPSMRRRLWRMRLRGQRSSECEHKQTQSSVISCVHQFSPGGTLSMRMCEQTHVRAPLCLVIYLFIFWLCWPWPQANRRKLGLLFPGREKKNLRKMRIFSLSLKLCTHYITFSIIGEINNNRVVSITC